METIQVLSVPRDVHCVVCAAIERRIAANIREGLLDGNRALAEARAKCEGSFVNAGQS